MRNILLLLLFTTVAAAQQADSIQINSPVHLREVPRHNLHLGFGIAQPSGDSNKIANSGLNIALGYDYYFNKSWSFTSSLRYVYNEFNVVLGDQRPFLFSQQSEDWTATSVSIGPQFSYTSNRFQLDVFTRVGVAFLKDNASRVTLASGSLLYDAFRYNEEQSNTAAAHIEGGLRVNYYFRRSVQLYFEPLFTTTIGAPIVYDGLQPDTESNFSNLLFNVGIKIALNPEYSNGEQRDDGSFEEE